MYRFIFMVMIVLLLSVASCASSTISPRTVSLAQGEASAEKSKSAEIASEWDRALAEAKKEGKVTIYTTYVPITRQAVSEGFFKRTGLIVEMVTGRGAEIAAKLITEHRNGLYLTDVYLGGTTTLLTALKPKGVLAPFEPLLFLPEVLDINLWYKNTLPWMDKDKLVLQTKMTPGREADIVYNTGLARKEELLSWYDLLNPKLKGKMNIQDPTSAGKGGKFVNRALTLYGLDWDYMRALAKQELVITTDKRLMIEWIVRGKHIVSLLPDDKIYEEFEQAGAPLKHLMLKESKDMLGGGASGIALINKAPHPNAAKLFINWWLSREGQTIFSQADNIQSAREDTPANHLPANRIRKPGVEYAVETEEFILQEPKMRALALEIFGPLLAR